MAASDLSYVSNEDMALVLKADTNYELAGRADNTAHAFADLRSAAKAKNRLAAENKQYYLYKGVKRGQLGQPHLVLKDGPKIPAGIMVQPVLPEAVEIVVMNKKMLFDDAQRYPKQPRYHRSMRALWMGPNYSPAAYAKQQIRSGQLVKDAVQGIDDNSTSMSEDSTNYDSVDDNGADTIYDSNGEECELQCFDIILDLSEYEEAGGEALD